MLHRGQAVGDDQRRAVPGELRQRLLHQPLRFGIERARRLVEQQDRRVLEDGARQRQPLALAAGEPQAAVADRWCRSPSGCAMMNSCAAAALAAATMSCFRRAEAAQRDVGADGVVEQRDVLG